MNLLDQFQKLSARTWNGLVLLLVFLALCLSDKWAIRWWLMLPLAAASGWILYRQWKTQSGFERTVCGIGLCVLLGLLLLRDIGMARRLADLFDRYGKILSRVNQDTLHSVRVGRLS